MAADEGDGVAHLKGPAQVAQPLRSSQGGLRLSCHPSDEVGRRYGTREAPSEVVGEEK